MKTIGIETFYGCSSLTSIVIPEGVTSIGSAAFYGCSSLTSIVIPEGVTSIRGYAFSGCTGLTSITIPGSVADIWQGAFYKCSGLTDITIHEGVTSIGEEAFYGCSSLTSIVIPESMTSIETDAFYGCENLKTVYNLSSLFMVKGQRFQGAVAYYADVLNDGWYFNGWRLTVTKNYDLDSCTEYPWYSFRSSIQSVRLGANVTTIGRLEFYQFYNLNDLIIPNSVTSIGSAAFADCISLRGVEFPEGVTSIGVNAFYRCYALWAVRNYSSLDIVKGADTHGLVAYYADHVLNFIKPLQLQKGEMYALSVPVVSEMVVTWSSSDASVAAVDQNGNVTAVGTGVATITATAGDYSATCEVTVTITDGVYYMRNVGSGLFLTQGNNWGTRGTLGGSGFEVTLTALPEGTYTIDTQVNNNGNHYLGADGYIDAPVANWMLEPQDDGTYAITLDGVNYIGYDGTSVLNMALTDVSDANTRWEFVTKDELKAELNSASNSNPMDATFLLPGASFNKNDTRNGLWSDAPTVGGYLTDVATNMCGEKWNTPSFDVAQTLTNLPNGYYKVSMQGFYRMGGDASKNDATIAAENHAAGTETLNAIFYANNEEKPLMSIIEGAQAEMFAYGQAFNTSYGYVPQNIGAAAATFTDGKYEHSLWVVVTDGTLRVGVKKDAESVNDWTIFDNFRIVYYGNHASGISIDRASMKLLKGESVTLSAEVTPEDATDAVTWSSSDASVATVDQNGNVTAVGAGIATITATAGDCSATCEVTVTIPVIPVSGITLSQNTASLFVDEGMTLSAEVTPEDATDKTVTWSSSDTNVATVTDGVVTAVGAGTAIITATAGEYSATCEVRVAAKVIPVSGIALSTGSVSLTEDDTYTLTATVSPDNATDKSVTWSSSDTSVATVTDGVVTAVGAGAATITATAGEYSATCEVTVTAKWTVTITDGVYYMRNVGSGLFLTQGNNWGTRGTLGESGFEVTLTALPEGTYTIDTQVNNNGNHYLGADGYIDAPVANWMLEPQDDGTYAITLDGVNYIGYDGTSVLNMALTDVSDANTRWEFVTKDELKAELNSANDNNPMDATFLLPGAGLNVNDTRNSQWSDGPSISGYQNETASNFCAEKWNQATFDVAQTLSDIPNGYYKAEMQGFYRMNGEGDVYDASLADAHRQNGTEALNAIFYANDGETPLMSILEGAQADPFVYGNSCQTSYGYVPNDMESASAAFYLGKYQHSLWVHVTDGTLRLGVKKDVECVNDWTIFDNFRLTYYGTEQPDGVESAVVETVVGGPADVYDLSGRIVKAQATDLSGLKSGLYIFKGKKYIVR